MTIYLDTSALVAAVVDCDARRVVLEALQDDAEWYSSALTISESLATVPRLTDELLFQTDLEDSLRLLWDRIAIVPIDQLCLERAGQITREQPVKITNAIHLAAAHRLPRPITYVTFDPAQIPVAISLDYSVKSTRNETFRNIQA